MSDIIKLNEDEKDCLQELMNISYGSATAAISEILDAFATLDIPKIQIIPSKDLKPHLKEKLKASEEHFLSTQLLNGSLNGENIFLINLNSATNLALEFGLEEDEINDNELFDIVLEVTNILSSATLGKLANELNTSVSFEPPCVIKIDTIDCIDNSYLQEYNQIIIISSVLKFKEQKIDAELLLLTKDDSIIWLKDSLDKILEEF